MVLGVIIFAIMRLGFGGGLVTICAERDYSGGGDLGKCVKEETIMIVATPENESGCPIGTKPVYDSVGGFVGVRFVGCEKK